MKIEADWLKKRQGMMKIVENYQLTRAATPQRGSFTAIEESGPSVAKSSDFSKESGSQDLCELS